MAQPWWVKVEGGDDAVNGMANFGVDSALRNSWYVANHTDLMSSPELGAAVMGANVDYGTAVRLDLAFKASKSQQQLGLQRSGGVPESMTDPLLSRPAQAQQAATQQQQKASPSGFWSGAWNSLKQAFHGSFGLNAGVQEAIQNDDKLKSIPAAPEAAA